MNFHPIKQVKTYRTLFHSNLFLIECKDDRIQFLIFNFAHQDFINRSHFLLQDLRPALLDSERIKIITDLFNHISKNIGDAVEVKRNKITLKLTLNTAQQPITFELPLTQSKLSANESIAYLKQFSKAKQDFYKSDILRLKTKIYTLMTDLEDATNLIKAHSLQTKNSKEQIKNLKRELKNLQEQKKKQQETSYIEVGVQHENSSQTSDIVEWVECPEVKQFSLDEEKLKNLTKFIENQIRENQKIITLTSIALPTEHNCAMRTSSDSAIPCEQQQKQEEKRVTYSPQKVCFFEKPSERFGLPGYSLKTLQSS